MLGKRSRSVIGRLSELLVPGSLSSLLDGPSTPLRRNQPENNPKPGCNDKSYNNNNNNSSSSIRKFDLGHHGVGLGIVMSLSSSSSSGSGQGTSPCSKCFVCSPGGYGSSDRDPGEDDGLAKEEEEEDYTYVTFHGPRASFTMVYYDQIEKERSDTGGDWSGSGRNDSPGQGFLRSCHLCGKKLHGQDIYMYRGEKGFCSVECRSEQVMMDERNELCRSDAADAWSYSSSAYPEGQNLTTSILAV